MDTTKAAKNIEDRRTFNKKMIVIRQNAPGINRGPALTEPVQESGTELMHPLMGMPYVCLVFIASGGDMETSPVASVVRRTMPRQAIAPTPAKQVGALLGGQLSPKVSRSAHEMPLTDRGPWHRDSAGEARLYRLSHGVQTLACHWVFDMNISIPIRHPKGWTPNESNPKQDCTHGLLLRMSLSNTNPYITGILQVFYSYNVPVKYLLNTC
jgi:hypothetical protein